MFSPFKLKSAFIVSSIVLLCSAAMVVQHSRASVPERFVSNGPAPADQLIAIRLALTSNNLTGLDQKLLSISDHPFWRRSESSHTVTGLNFATLRYAKGEEFHLNWRKKKSANSQSQTRRFSSRLILY